MGFFADQFQGWNRSTVLLVGDATREIISAPGANKHLFIRRLTLTIIVSAVQSVDVESSDGTIELIKAAPSLAAGVQLHFGSSKGYELPANTALRIQPTAAGVSCLVTAEGYISGGF